MCTYPLADVRPPDAVRWPMFWRRTFPGTAARVREARRFAAGLLDGDPACDDAAWIVGELAGNAILHSRSGLPGGSYTVEVARSAWAVRLCVVDEGGGGDPVGSEPDGLSEHGRGLLGVGRLARCHGSHPVEGGRMVWAMLLADLAP